MKQHLIEIATLVELASGDALILGLLLIAYVVLQDTD